MSVSVSVPELFLVMAISKWWSSRTSRHGHSGQLANKFAISSLAWSAAKLNMTIVGYAGSDELLSLRTVLVQVRGTNVTRLQLPTSCLRMSSATRCFDRTCLNRCSCSDRRNFTVSRGS